MLYDVKVNVSGGRSITYKKSTKIGVQNILESFLADRSAFTFVVEEHVHNHLWYSVGHEGSSDVNFMCKDCDETFKISQPALTVIFIREQTARENMFS